MDGTLLNSDGKLSQGNKIAIEKAMKKGVHVVISTGRVFGALPKDVLAVQGIEYAVTSNGARVVKLEDKSTIYTNLIQEEKMHQIAECILKENLLIELFFDGNVFIDKKCFDSLESYGLPAKYSDYVLKTRATVDDLKETVYGNLGSMENININFNCMKQKEQLWKELKQIDGITITTSLSHNIEIGGATTSKADGIAHLCELLGIEKEQVMACGDSPNDGSMLSYAGLAVAMGNAAEEVKRLADFITRSNDEDGVAYAIEKFVLDGTLDL